MMLESSTRAFVLPSLRTRPREQSCSTRVAVTFVVVPGQRVIVEKCQNQPSDGAGQKRGFLFFFSDQGKAAADES